ncbi:complexed with cdc5 protein cwf19 [Moniliophthora roreri]|nr:complexed with cdc5 protein cwf19 [Moniliophthora roreri]
MESQNRQPHKPQRRSVIPLRIGKASLLGLGDIGQHSSRASESYDLFGKLSGLVFESHIRRNDYATDGGDTGAT